ncbi:MAG: cytochrome c [Deltaproteobacteria bacterium]|nr:cytochrome c [Deltaproteobacteria bacterium]
MKKILLFLFLFSLALFEALTAAPQGEQIFNTKCALCHTMGGGKKIGPDLKGVTKKRTKEWMRKMIKDPMNFVKTDPEAKKIFEEYKKMPMVVAPPLTDAEIDAVIKYLEKK